MAGIYNEKSSPVTIVHSNLDQDVIQITEDRLRLILKDHLGLAEERKTWIAPLGILLAIVIAFVTTDFHDFYFKAPVWQAIFFISGLISFIWLCIYGYKAFSIPTINYIISKIKHSE